MGTYIKNTEDRKDISRRIVELTGEKLKYTMPASSFVGRGFTLTREGILEADETADKTVLETLIAEGLILALAETDTEAETGAEGQESAEDTHEAEETVTEPTGEGQETIAEPAGSEGLTISVPLNGHTGLSLRNLISMIYSRGRLISKATGGSFSCTEGLADYLKDDSFITTSEKLIRAVADYEKGNDKALTGLTFEEDKVSFTGFPYTQDSDKVQAFQQLTAQMNKLAREQKRTQVKKVDESNEKYIFRIWLLRLGMAGTEFKTARKIMLAPLSGDIAFKDEAMRSRWKEKQVAARDELKDAKAGTEGDTDEISE